MSSSQNSAEKTVYRHTRTISIVSDSTLSKLSRQDGEEIFQSPISSPWSSLKKSPSAASFYSLTSEEFYDVFEEPNLRVTKSLESLSVGHINKAFELEEPPANETTQVTVQSFNIETVPETSER